MQVIDHSIESQRLKTQKSNTLGIHIRVYKNRKGGKCGHCHMTPHRMGFQENKDLILRVFFIRKIMSLKKVEESSLIYLFFLKGK